MRASSLRLHPSALSWIALTLACCLLAGCQKWSLRQNMNSFFGGETKDDWEPPVKSPSDLPRTTSPDEDPADRPWWGKGPRKGLPRVVLPRDRKSVAANTSVEVSPPPQPNTESNVTKTQPQATQPQATQPQVTQPQVQPAQIASNTERNEGVAKGDVVAFGANPNGRPGDVVAAPRSEPGRDPSAAKPGVIDTGIEDLDVEASLKNLPPQFRDVVMRTLQSVKEGKPTEPQEPVATVLASKETPDKTTSQPSEPSRSVSVRLSEATVASMPAANPTSPADVAVAVAQPKNPDPVVQTSANLPSEEASLRTVSPSFSPSATPPSATPPSATLPATPSSKPTTWHGIISEAVERLESDLESKSATDDSLRRSQEITLRMLYVAQRRLDDALRPIDRMDAHEQEYVRHQMQALYEASNPDANPARPRHWSTVMVSQREATAHLAAVSNLEVRSVAFCTQVDGYGTFKKFTKNQFQAGQDILLYCEIDNVAAEKVKGGFETQLQGSYEIRDPQGRLITDQDLPMEPEVCMNHRRDYFIVYRIFMPSQMQPGNYELRLTIEDKKGGKYGHSTASFEVRN